MCIVAISLFVTICVVQVVQTEFLAAVSSRQRNLVCSQYVSHIQYRPSSTFALLKSIKPITCRSHHSRLSKGWSAKSVYTCLQKKRETTTEATETTEAKKLYTQRTQTSHGVLNREKDESRMNSK